MEKKRDNFFIQNKKLKPEKKEFKQQSKKNDKRQKEFDVNRNGLNEESEKKPFDKKTYRLKKYSKKYKLEKWEEQRKKRMLNEYQKSMKNETITGSYKPMLFDEDVTDSSVGRFVKHPDLIEKEIKESLTKNGPYSKAKQQFSKVKQANLEKQQKIEKANQERTQKLQEYKKKKHERFKKLSKKTKKGQPVLLGRMELLLERIQGSK